MKIGDVVKNKRTGAYGIVNYSSFGFSIHSWDEGVRSKTVGCPASEISEYWEIVRRLPKGYKKDGWGVVKNEQ